MSSQLRRLRIRTPKEDASFIYFTLESNEGLAFYSTLEDSIRGPYRDIELYSPMSLASEFQNLLDHLKSSVSYDILEDVIVEDHNPEELSER